MPRVSARPDMSAPRKKSGIAVVPLRDFLDARIVPEPNSGCWIWVGALNDRGYGMARGKRAHRLMYESAYGPVPAGLEPDHRCRVRCCVNPSHLEAVTRSVNILRGKPFARRKLRELSAAAETCRHGHPLSPENLYITPDGARACKRCRYLAKQRYQRGRREGGGTKRTSAITPAPKSACDHGHALTPENLYVGPNGHRACRRCNAIGARRYRLSLLKGKEEHAL